MNLASNIEKKRRKKMSVNFVNLKQNKENAFKDASRKPMKEI